MAICLHKMKEMNKIQHWIRGDFNPASWKLFGWLSLAIFAKCVLFQWNCFHSIIVSSLWRNPIDFFDFWLPKIAISIFFASIVFLTKRKRWTILLLTIIDIWCIANLIYYRSYNAFLDWDTIQLARNMDGFWGSIFIYTSIQDIFYPVITIIYIGILWLYRNKGRNLQGRDAVSYTIVVICSYLIALGGVYCFSNKLRDDLIANMYDDSAEEIHFLLSPNPFSSAIRFAPGNTSDQIYRFSVLHSFVWTMTDMLSPTRNETSIDISKLNNKTIQSIEKLNIGSHAIIPDSILFDSKIVIVIVESLESWVINDYATPHMCEFMRNHTCAFIPKLTCQVQRGMSADGQMIINTGLLPVVDDVTCYTFPSNRYPSIGECCTGRTLNIIPHKIDVWNQQYMSPAYAYDTTIVCNEEDSVLAYQTLKGIRDGYQMIQMITMSSHAPFTYGASRSHLQTPEDMPVHMANYMKSINYADAGLNVLLEALGNDTTMRDITLVITGDHIIFPAEKRAEYANVCKNKGIDYAIQDAYVPLIISQNN